MSPDNGSAPFASTAKHYARHRPGYSDRTIAYVRDRFSLDGTGRVLDLGCGTGEIAIPLSEHVDQVLAIDPEEAMLTEAQRKAAVVEQTNIEWRTGSDADLPELTGPFRLATMGRSFHWMEQNRTLEELFRLLEPPGGIALFGNAEWFARGTRAWQDEVYAVAMNYLDDVPERTGPIEYDDPWDEKIAAFGFTDVEKQAFPVRREWTVDGIVGYLLSLSFCSPAKLGDQQEAFEEDVRACLKEMERETFVQDDSETVISGMRPRNS